MSAGERQEVLVGANRGFVSPNFRVRDSSPSSSSLYIRELTGSNLHGSGFVAPVGVLESLTLSDSLSAEPSNVCCISNDDLVSDPFVYLDNWLRDSATDHSPSGHTSSSPCGSRCDTVGGVSLLSPFNECTNSIPPGSQVSSCRILPP